MKAKEETIKRRYHVPYVISTLPHGELTASRPTTWAAAAAMVGGLLGFVGVMSLLLAPESPYGLLYQSGTLGAFLRQWAGPASHALTTLSLGGVLALAGGVRSRFGIVGGLVAFVSLVGMLGFFFYQTFIFDPVQKPWAGPPLLLIIAGYAAFLGKPATLLIFGLAALRAGTAEYSGLLLLGLGALEAAPLIGYNSVPSWPFPEVEWLWVVLGLPSLGTGLVETAGWIILGYAILRLGPEHKRRKLQEEQRTQEHENLHKACKLYEEAFEAGNLSVIDELLADDFFDHLHHCRGPQAFKRTIATLRKRFPDLELSIEDQSANGDTVTTRCELSGTDEGGVLWYPPTGKRVVFHVVYVDRFREGKLVEHQEKMDTTGLLKQLGLPLRRGQSSPT